MATLHRRCAARHRAVRSRASRAMRVLARNPRGARSRDGLHGLRCSPALADSSWRPIGGRSCSRARAMPQLLGSPESHLEVLALHDGRLAPIPFQVDEVLPDGRYALPDGPEPLADDSPGILDRDDEIAMMLSDLGDRASPAPRELPRGRDRDRNVRRRKRRPPVCVYRGRSVAASQPRLLRQLRSGPQPYRGRKLSDDLSRRFSDRAGAERRPRQTLAESHRGFAGAGDGAGAEAIQAAAQRQRRDAIACWRGTAVRSGSSGA